MNDSRYKIHELIRLSQKEKRTEENKQKTS